MFASSLTLKNAAAAVVTYIRVVADLTKAVYAHATSTLSLPIQLTIAHQVAKSPTGTDRHLLKHARTVSTLEGKLVTSVFNVTAAIPREGITRAHINDDIAALREFLNDEARVTAWLNGEC